MIKHSYSSNRRAHRRAHRRAKSPRTFFCLFWCVTMLALIGFWVLVFSVSINGCRKVRDKGLKTVVNQIWEGPTNSVLPHNN